MKILILGGTGAMGKHLVNLLALQNDVEIWVTSRRIRSNRINVFYIQGNAHDLTFLSSLLTRRFDIVIDFMSYSMSEFRERLLYLLSSCGHYFFLSSSRVYADSESPLTEDSPRLLDVSTDSVYLSSEEYSLTKARQENLLYESGYSNWTIIRPYITYSESRLQLGVQEMENWLYRALCGRTIVFSKDIAKKMTTLTYGLDVARGMAALVGKEEAKGESFHIITSESIQWNGVLEIYLDVLEQHIGIRPKVIMTEKSYKLDFLARKYQVIYDRLYNRCFDNSKIARFIDVNTFQSPINGLRSCLATFLNKPKFRAINFGDEAIFDRIAGERTSWSEIPTLKQKVKYGLYKFIIR